MLPDSSLAVAADSSVLPTMIIFKGSKHELKDIHVPPKYLICVLDKALMDETLMLDWIRNSPSMQTPSLLVLDRLRAPGEKKEVRKAGGVTAIIPG